MISFLLEESVLTATTLSSVFTVGLLNSLRNNILEPSFEIYWPHHLISDKENLSGSLPGSLTTAPTTNKSNTVKWKTFLKDFVYWLIIMFFIFTIWKYVFHPIKMKNKKF